MGKDKAYSIQNSSYYSFYPAFYRAMRLYFGILSVFPRAMDKVARYDLGGYNYRVPCHKNVAQTKKILQGAQEACQEKKLQIEL